MKNLRSSCVLNEGFTLRSDELWTFNLAQAANWTFDEVEAVWKVFARQEALRLCMYGLFLIDHYISSVCNLRPSLWPAELMWDIPPASEMWECPSADEWLDLVQDAYQRGSLPMASVSSRRELTMSQVTQSLLTGKPSTRLVKQLSASPFATICIASAIDSLVRDFSASHYCMPPVLPDPSAYHVLSPVHNRRITAAISSVLALTEKGRCASSTASNLVKLVSWTTRVGLCEPDDMLIAGIVDTHLAAGLATSTHLVQCRNVATRRGAITETRRFGHGASLAVWDDLLKSLSLIVGSSEDQSCHGPPWVPILSYRALLLLWKLVRRAKQELHSSDSPTLGLSETFCPADMFMRSVQDKLKQLMPWNTVLENSDPEMIEIALVSLMTRVFSRDPTPVGALIYKIVQESDALLISPR